MRITKKYAGASCIGKQVFQLSDNYYECFQENERELQRLENLFLVRINGKGGGLSSKRGTADVLPVPHQSIYETSNLDPSASSATNYHPTILLSSASKRPYKTNRQGSGSKAAEKNQNHMGLNLTMALGGSPQLVNHRHSHSTTDSQASHHHQAHFSQYDAYRSGSDYEDQSGDDDYYEEGGEDRTSDVRQGTAGDGDYQEDDYGYVYDPDCDADSGAGHVQQQRMLRQYQQQHILPSTGSPAAAATKSGFYSSFQAGGRRVLSAPNLTELNLSHWKDTAFRPLPADSLKEMFSLPLGAPHHLAGGIAAGAGYDAYGKHTRNASLLPDHVYSAMGNESGRYAKGNGNGRGKGATNSTNNSSAAAVMAARAKATMLALQRHRQEQQHHRPPQHNHSLLGEGRAMDDTHALRNPTAAMGGSPKPRMKRSHSAMALVDFERLAGDDTAAGNSIIIVTVLDFFLPSSCKLILMPISPLHSLIFFLIPGDLFLQFLNKVSGTSNVTTPRVEPKMEEGSARSAGSNALNVTSSDDPSAAVTEGLVTGEMTQQCDDVRSIAQQQQHSADFDGKVVVVLPSIPAATLLLPTDADLILPSSVSSVSSGGTASNGNVDAVATATITATLTATTTEESLDADGSAMDLG